CRMLLMRAEVQVRGGSASSGRQKWTTDQAAGSLIENAGEKSTATFDAEAFEKSLSNLSASERVAIVKNQAKNIAQEYGWKKDNKLSRINNRDIYQTEDGEIYSVDTQHGRLEKINPRNGNHLGEFNFNLDPTGKIDRSGGHDIKVR
ncbi:colicin E3/pyocin S6 family cytotoxin, partial [Asaia platycodi]|uniref:colicin E3/pyocin S6 family cytotoxin n=1 Tax=Asaia platycodi TaxID=610243 RepID=UPI00047074A9